MATPLIEVNAPLALLAHSGDHDLGIGMSVRALVTALTLGILLLSGAPAQPSEEPASSEPRDMSDLMISIQLRHIKLWFAGKLGNWRLAGYELDRVVSDLERASKRTAAGFMPDPAAKSLQSLRAEIDARNSAGFVRAYTELTRECNVCHRASGRDFIAVQIPLESPFTDQVFEDRVAQGRGLARNICGTCHIVPDNVRPGLRSPAPSFVELANRPSFTEKDLRDLLGSNHRRVGPAQAMPNPRLSDTQIDEIVAYFEALKAEHGRR